MHIDGVYLYDSLPSGAGDCVQAGERTEELLERTMNIIQDCTCDRACYECLKHYRNQRIHNSLNRHAVIELLEYGRSQRIPAVLSVEEVHELLKQLEHLLGGYGIGIEISDGEIKLTQGQKQKVVS